jgi:extracellular elastinolytic metalloproteinase
MSESFDVRENRWNLVEVPQDRTNALAAAADGVQCVEVAELRVRRVDGFTQNPAAVDVDPTGSSSTGDLAGDAFAVLTDRQVSRLLGAPEGSAMEFATAPVISLLSSGASVVHLAQTWQRLPIFQASATVRFSPQGLIQRISSRLVTVENAPELEPTIKAEEAIVKAAGYVSDETFEPTLRSGKADEVHQPHTFEPGPFGDVVRTRLRWFWEPERLRLAWESSFLLPGKEGRWRVLIDAGDGTLLYRQEVTRRIAATALVYPLGADGERSLQLIPRAVDQPNFLIDLRGLDRDPSVPTDWVADNATTGPTIHAVDADTREPVSGRATGTTLPLAFEPADPEGDEQAVLNAFFLSCTAYDVAHIVGFREADGSYIRNNPSVSTDRTTVLVHTDDDSSWWDPGDPLNALDGGPTLHLGAREVTHDALDPTVVLHEYFHGVTGQLVGGHANTASLEWPHSRGLAEGWSDYVACALTRATAIAPRSTGDPKGLRGVPYDESYHATFGDLSDRELDVYDLGERWAATLLSLDRAVVVPEARGHLLQIVADSWKTVENPSLEDARDDLLAAHRDRLASGRDNLSVSSATRSTIWQVLAEQGLSGSARSLSPSEFQPDTTPAGPEYVEYRQSALRPRLSVLTTFSTLSGLVGYDEAGRNLHTYLVNDEARLIEQWGVTPWAGSCTALLPFRNGLDDLLLTYDAYTGLVRIGKLDLPSGTYAVIYESTGTTGWTHFTTFMLNGHPHVVCYNAESGRVQLDQVKQDGTGTVTVLDTTWEPGWTSFVPFDAEGATHLLRYNTATGAMSIVKPGGDSSSFVDVKSGFLSPGWTYTRTFARQGETRVLMAAEGRRGVTIYRIADADLVPTTVCDLPYARTTLLPFSGANGVPYFVGYDAERGRAVAAYIQGLA